MLSIFYTLLNMGYRLIFGNRYMLHAPLFRDPEQTLLDAQTSLVEHCLSFLGNLKDTRILDVGCGNDMQTMNILKKFEPASIIGIDLVASQIGIAQRAIPKGENRIRFEVDNAEVLRSVASSSIDVLVCLESALHYRYKERFLIQARRVLAPGGHMVIADLLVRKNLKAVGALSLYNWTHEQYINAFSLQRFRVTADLSLNELLLGQLPLAGAAIARELRAHNSFTAPLKLLVVRPVLALYTAQLNHRFNYRLFTVVPV